MAEVKSMFYLPAIIFVDEIRAAPKDLLFTINKSAAIHVKSNITINKSIKRDHLVPI